VVKADTQSKSVAQMGSWYFMVSYTLLDKGLKIRGESGSLPGKVNQA